MRWIIAAVILLIGIPTVQAQDSNSDVPCPQLWFLPGQPLRVIGSIDFGGLSYRRKPELAEPVEGVLPLRTIFWASQPIEPVCAENRIWIEIERSNTIENAAGMWVVLGDENTEWVEPSTNCSDYTDPLLVEGRIRWMTFDPATQALQVDVTTNYRYSLSFDTWRVTRTPNQPTLTPQERAALNLDDDTWFNVVTVPDGNNRLIFVANPWPKGCSEGCGSLSIYLSSKETNQITPIGTAPDDEAFDLVGLTQYGSKLYLNYFGGPSLSFAFTTVICLDGSCKQHQLEDELQTLAPDLPLVYPSGSAISHAFPTFSPDGRFMAVSRLTYNLSDPDGDIIIELNTGRYWMLPPNGNVTIPVLWSGKDFGEDSVEILYPVDSSELPPTFADLYPHYTYFTFQDDLWALTMDLESGTLAYRGAFNNRSVSADSASPEMFFLGTSRYVLTPDGKFVVDYDNFLKIYCIGRG